MSDYSEAKENLSHCKKNDADWMYSLGTIYAHEKTIFQKSGERTGFTKRLKEENGVSSMSLHRCHQFMLGVNDAERICPGAKDFILSGSVPKSIVMGLHDLNENDMVSTVRSFMDNNFDLARAIVRDTKIKPKEEPPTVDDAPVTTSATDGPEYTAEDFGRSIKAAVDALDFSLKQHMVLVHIDMLSRKDSRETAEQELLRGKEVIKRYLGLIESVRMVQE